MLPGRIAEVETSHCYPISEEVIGEVAKKRKGHKVHSVAHPAFCTFHLAYSS